MTSSLKLTANDSTSIIDPSFIDLLLVLSHTSQSPDQICHLQLIKYVNLCIILKIIIGTM